MMRGWAIRGGLWSTNGISVDPPMRLRILTRTLEEVNTIGATHWLPALVILISTLVLVWAHRKKLTRAARRSAPDVAIATLLGAFGVVLATVPQAVQLHHAIDFMRKLTPSDVTLVNMGAREVITMDANAPTVFVGREHVMLGGRQMMPTSSLERRRCVEVYQSARALVEDEGYPIVVFALDASTPYHRFACLARAVRARSCASYLSRIPSHLRITHLRGG